MNVQNDTKSGYTNLASEFVAVAERLRLSTVQVLNSTGVGSGIIWHSNGIIVTNAHVTRGARATVKLWDGQVFEAAVARRDPVRDLAMLKVEAADLPAAKVGDSDTLRVGELVLAIGNPLGLVGALTTGIISRVGSVELSTRQRWIVADVRLSPGNSGGPLANAQGLVIGINSMIAGGLALAVPSNAVERFLHLGESLSDGSGVEAA